MTVIEAEVVKAVPADVTPAFIREVLGRATTVAEIGARLPDGKASVALRITSDEEMRKLNRDFAGEDHATDVLSFAGDGDHLGDIAISWPAAVRQAKGYGHDAKTEVALLAVHGLLHLLGWDHTNSSANAEMTRLTVLALQASGVKLGPRRL